ncbi:putative ABC transport system permease protein [Flavobacterium tiangeerense]|uniref:ABC transport system permease protein n=1 Tax=Flavobacterium tiangeerense TaxID=459471 RepID=A0ABY3FJH2_9FLAO|nr:ABC transporter permease [Flavobacterium tiangeerense]TWH99085.1 putative ABC transport system permease protein [Flavobacterium tiangeerense]
MILNWIKIFIYHLKQNKLFSFLNVLGLSIGIAGVIFAILYWNDEQSYDAWNPEKENVFLVANQMSENTFWASSSAPIGAAIKEKSSEVASYCYLSGNYESDLIRFKNKKVQSSKIVLAQKNFFEFFPYEFVEGNQKSALPDENSISLSQGLALQLFGKETALGKEVLFQNKKITVRGVYKMDKKSSYNPSAVVNFIDLRIRKSIVQWGNFQFVLFLKVKNPSKVSLVENDLQKLYYDNLTVRFAQENGITPEQYIEKYGTTKPSLEPLSTIRLHTKTSGLIEENGNFQFLMIMVGLSVLILLLSIVNYINSATANAIKRAKEVGVRKVIGSSKINIIQQFVFETAILSLFSILIALVLVELSLPYYNDFLDKTIVVQGSQFYLQLIIIFSITVCLAGVFPAIYVSNFEALKVLKGNFGRSKSGVWLRNGMLIFQFSIATFFIIGFYIVYQQIDHINKKDLGFKANQILSISYRNVYGEEITDNFRFDRYLTIKNELLRIPGVKQVAAGGFAFGGSAKSTITLQYKDLSVDGDNIPIDFGMLEMMQIKLVKGRYLSPKFAQDTINTMLINETAARLLKEKKPIGKKVNWNGKELIIVGVVKDFNIGNPAEAIPPMSIFHFKTNSWLTFALNNIYIDAVAKTIDQTVADLENFWLKKVDPDYPFVYDFVDKDYQRSYSSYVKQKNLFSILNIEVILIALFGLFCLASFSIERRMKEIAVRKTLGAETNILLKELSKQYIIYCVIGFLIAVFPAYYLLNKWLENFAYRIDISIYPFLIGFIALLSLTLLVVLSKAYQATRVDVLQYLKYE